MAEDVLISDSFPHTKKRMKSGKTKGIKDIEEIPLTTQTEETNSKTKARFDQLLKQAVDQGNNSDSKPKRKKKKPKTADGEDVLEKLKKGEGLIKDEDAAIIANTYVPGDSPKNKKTNSNLEGTENFGYEDETSLTIPSNKSTKKRKKKDTNLITSNSLPSDEGTDRANEIVLGEREQKKTKSKLPPLVTSESKEKKVKKKKTAKSLVDLEAGESTTSPIVSPRDEHSNNKTNTTSDVERGDNSLSPKAPSPKKKKDKNVSNSADVTETSEAEKVENVPKKKKKKKVAKMEEHSDDQQIESPRSEMSATGEEEQITEVVDEVSATKSKRKKKKVKETTTLTSEGETTQTVKDEGRILAITVHRTDKLKNDFYIMHPVVRVHIVNEETGQYLAKQDSQRPVTSFYENEHEDTIGHIQPIITQPFDFKLKKSILPMWEEILIFNENFNYFVQKEPKVIIFFEVLDFVSMTTASRQYSEAKEQGGWHRIAWAFLKVVGSNEHLNTGNKVRLQLYHPPERFLLDPGHIELFQWWETAARRPYPSTIYVTLKGIISPSKVEPSMRSLYATQEEVGRMTYQDLKKSGTLNSKTRGDGQKKYLTTWNRLAGQSCKVPNNLFLSLYAGKKGCFVLKFSHDGRSLACACHDKDGFPIYIYEIPSGELLGKLSGHFGIVYDLCWCKSDTHLLSASSDGTARVWDVSEIKDPSELLLPHPAFVYTAQFHPHVDTVIATGGYDQVIRVWQMSPDLQQPELLQEIEGHRGNVNTLCFDEDGSKLYSADSMGDIKIWNVYVSDDLSRKGFIRDWGLYQDVQEPELVGVPINYLRIHPSGRRLLVHCRDNIIRMLDLRILRVMQKYIGALNFREEIHSTFSPCGTFVFAGSEDGSAYVWNTETGDQVACYSELNYHQPVTSLDYHPRDHMVAFCSLGENQAVFIYKYNPQVAALDAGIPVKPKENVDKLKNTNKAGGVYTKDEFEASETARLEKVMKKLSSVTMSSRPMIPAESHPLGVHDPSPRTLRTGLLGSSSWGYDQSSTYLTPRSQSPPPPMFSPHASSTLSSSMQQQQLKSHSMYLKQGEGSWRPEFSSVGRHGARPSSPTFWGKAPNISLNASNGKAQFSFQPPVGKAHKLRKVVALYEYRGQRSDELSFLKGELIKVLYKDNENWWMGELKGGQQGFFPANYVTEEEPSGDDMEDDSVNQEEEIKEEKKKEKKKVTAYKSKTGELRFLSATEDSEDDGQQTSKSRSRRRKNGADSVSPRNRKPPEIAVKGRPLKGSDESYA